MVKGPSVVAVEGVFKQVQVVLVFSQHKNRFDGIQFLACLFPEIGRYATGIVAPVAVDICFDDPEFQGIQHGSPHSGIFVVQVGHITPVSNRRNHMAQGIPGVPIDVVFHPRVVPRSMIRHAVDQDLETHSMCFIHQLFKIFHRTEFRIDGFVIPDGIIGTQGPLPVLFAYGMNRHEPENFYSQFL